MSFKAIFRFVLALCVMPALSCRAATFDYGWPSPKYEVRAVWLTTYGGLDWPRTVATNAATAARQQRELCAILDSLRAAGINTVLFQTRIRATTIYPSAFEPLDACLAGRAGTSPGYDVLRFAIEECHKRGLQLHAWVVAMPAGRWDGFGCSRLRTRHKGMVRKIGNAGYLNPEVPATADYIAAICGEIASEYDVDGIHLDYIRYPEKWPRPVDAAKARANITRIVRAVHDVVKGCKPWVRLSCSPIGKYADLPRCSSRGWNARDCVFQDAQLWMREGLVDAVFPMMYFRGDGFARFALDWLEASDGRTVSSGLGIYFLSPSERDWPIGDVERQLGVLRTIGLGHAFFRSRFLTDNVKGLLDFVRNDFDCLPALPPPMTWQHTEPPAQLAELCVKRMETSDVLSWRGAAVGSDAPCSLYNVYASRHWPVDVSDPSNILAVAVRGDSLVVPRPLLDAPTFYAVAAVDRYGLESVATQQPAPPAPVAAVSWLRCEGGWLELPEKETVLDAPFLAVETLQGSIVTTMPFAGDSADVAALARGIYVLRTLNAKGVSHRLGHFIIR